MPDPLWSEASRRAAFEVLQQFLPRAGAEYTAQRNFDYGPARRSHVSGLSPYIRHRLIHEGEVLDATLQRYSVTTASKFIEEIFWRAYFKGWLEQHPTVWADYRSVVQALVESLDRKPELKTRYERAIDGRTGDQLGLPSLPRDWSRTLHARLIDELTRQIAEEQGLLDLLAQGSN